jgi:hypothetical protein
MEDDSKIFKFPKFAIAPTTSVEKSNQIQKREQQQKQQQKYTFDVNPGQSKAQQASML